MSVIRWLTAKPPAAKPRKIVVPDEVVAVAGPSIPKLGGDTAIKAKPPQ